MQEGSLVLTIFILLCTILPALVPSVFLIFTNSHISTQILAPVCYSLGQGSGLQKFDHRVCLSCYVRDQKVEPFKLKIGQSNSKLYENSSTHIKKVIQFNNEIQKLSGMLSCEDIGQLLNIKTHVQSLDNFSIDQINFEEDIVYVKEIVNSLGMSMSASTKKKKISLDPKTQYFAVMQLVKVSGSLETEPLIEVSFPSKKYKTDFLQLVDIFCKASLVFCLIAFVFKRYSQKITSYEMFASGTVIFGFLISFRNYRLDTDNFYYRGSEFLYMAICLKKVEMMKEAIFVYMLIQIMVPYVIFQKYLLELVQIGFYVLTAVLIFVKASKLKQQEHLSLYMGFIWVLLGLMIVCDGGDRDFIYVFGHSTVLILSSSVVEFLTKKRTQELEEYLAVSKFTEIKSFEEMEEISEFK